MSYSPNFRGNSSNASARSARSLTSNYQNGSGFLLVQCTPVAMNSFGQLIKVDVSDESTIINLMGVLGQDLANAASGAVYDGGRVEDVDLSAFAIGDALYIAKDGFLTNVKPDVGVGGFLVGDFVVFIGIVVKNEFNPSLKDLKLLIDAKIGQL